MKTKLERYTWRTIYNATEDYLGRVFIRWVTQWVSRRFFGTMLVGGIWGWIIAYLAEKSWVHIVRPVIRWSKRKVIREVNRQRVRDQLEEIRDAENEHDFDRAVDRLD